MKQLLSLLLISAITAMSWSCFAKSTVINVTSLYVQPPTKVSSMVLTPSLSHQQIDENFTLASTTQSTRQVNFFEFAIIFNEKLQQFIAFFTSAKDVLDDVASNNYSHTDITAENSEQVNIKKCKASS